MPQYRVGDPKRQFRGFLEPRFEVQFEVLFHVDNGAGDLFSVFVHRSLSISMNKTPQMGNRFSNREFRGRDSEFAV
jgi:hypothetical protein